MPKQDKLNDAPFACPATQMVRVIGGRWKLNILYQIQQNVHRYSDLQRCLPGITPKMLTQQLRELEDDGIVHREVYRQVPPKVEYSMTPLGESLAPVFNAMCEWSRCHIPGKLQAEDGVDKDCVNKSG